MHPGLGAIIKLILLFFSIIMVTLFLVLFDDIGHRFKFNSKLTKIKDNKNPFITGYNNICINRARTPSFVCNTKKKELVHELTNLFTSRNIYFSYYSFDYIDFELNLELYIKLPLNSKSRYREDNIYNNIEILVVSSQYDNLEDFYDSCELFDPYTENEDIEINIDIIKIEKYKKLELVIDDIVNYAKSKNILPSFNTKSARNI